MMWFIGGEGYLESFCQKGNDSREIQIVIHQTTAIMVIQIWYLSTSDNVIIA